MASDRSKSENHKIMVDDQLKILSNLLSTIEEIGRIYADNLQGNLNDLMAHLEDLNKEVTCLQKKFGSDK